MFERLNVSEQLKDLRLLKLDGFFGVVNKFETHVAKLYGIIHEMAKTAGVPCVHEMKGPYDGTADMRWRSLITVNHQFVARGFSKTDTKCKNDCAKNAFYFLISIGLQFIFDHEIPDEQVRKIDRSDIEASSMKQLFDSLLEDKTLLKLMFCFRLTQSEKELLDALCDLHSLSKHFDGTGQVMVFKRNSFLHKMELLKKEKPVPEIPAKVITKEELSVNTSIRDHIEKFANDNSVAKLQFPDGLDVTQKELIELLADKHKLKKEVDDSNQTILVKSPDRVVEAKVPQTTVRQTKVSKFNPSKRETLLLQSQLTQVKSKSQIYKSVHKKIDERFKDF